MTRSRDTQIEDSEDLTMTLVLRRSTLDDAAPCGEICYTAFKTVAEQHHLPPDFPSPEIAVAFLSSLLPHANFYGVVAELDGRVVGSNFLDERAVIAGIGPITVDPNVQNRAVGRALMEDVLHRAAAQRHPGVRLVQAAYHNRSMSLYTKLGFTVREPLSTLQGDPLNAELPGYAVRSATGADLTACNELCRRIHGHDRSRELADAVRLGTATVVLHGGRITGYASEIAMFGHAVGSTNADLQALIGAAPAFGGPGFLVPTRNAELLRWCLNRGLRIVQPMSLMSIGLYNEPAGSFLPSVTF